jgi:hypothetical protein
MELIKSPGRYDDFFHWCWPEYATCDPMMGIGQAITIPLFFASNVPLRV